jgi:hypothetical protein
VAQAEDIRGLSVEDYRAAIEISVAEYRRAVLKHMLLNSWRAPLPVVASQITQKAVNLVVRLARGDTGH